MASTRRAEVLGQLRRYESQNVTFLPDRDTWPIVWERAQGMRVWDTEGKEYWDFTAAFGVAAAGHAAPAVVRAGRKQMGTLLHAMGDVHPHPLKAELAARLSALTYGRWDGGAGKVVFTNSGSEAVEVAMKSSCSLTGRREVICFRGGYHGLGYGSLVATDRDHFRGRFGGQLADFSKPLDFPISEDDLGAVAEALEQALQSRSVGAVLVEPIQARGGVRVPPVGFLSLLRSACDRHGVALVLDEIYTGFGRTGAWFACEAESVVPDWICVGKALTGGFPMAACIGKAELMDQAWPKSEGEAIHTSTFLGHPVGCAMALAQLALLEQRDLVGRAGRSGARLLRRLAAVFSDDRVTVRGRGLMIGLACQTADGEPDTELCLAWVEAMLAAGYILLPGGEWGHVVEITPPLIVTRGQADDLVTALGETYGRLVS